MGYFYLRVRHILANFREALNPQQKSSSEKNSNEVDFFILLKLPLILHELPTQEPGPVVVPPFEATRLNDDIWAAVHREMVGVAEVLNSMNENKGDNEEPSSSTARNGSVPRRPYGVGH